MRISDWSSDVCSSDLRARVDCSYRVIKALRPSEPFAPFVGVLKLCMEAPLNVKAAINLSDDFQRNGRPCFKLMPTLVGSDTAPDLDRPGLTNRSDEVHALHTAPTLLADAFCATCLAAIAGPFCPQPASNVRQVIRLALSASLRWARRAGGILLDFCHAHPVVTGAFIRSATLAAPPISSNMSLMRSDEHPSELQSLMRIPYAVLCLKKKTLQ